MAKMKCFSSSRTETAGQQLSKWTNDYFGGQTKEIVDVKIINDAIGNTESIIVLYEDRD